ncbi:hypothetical protein E2C01_067280 [Portunus trituberculatus]|uniref:Uncharacterized protein n=1 Tax=Portunus trituberculatus TaxID=210409 RepID=A0A5B7HX16_PORTR|nr:hypothetical protein [Portunus trituberculatus]
MEGKGKRWDGEVEGKKGMHHSTLAGIVISSSFSVTRVPASPLLTNLPVLVPEGRTNAAEARRVWNVTEKACLGGVGGVLEGTWCGKTKMEQGE